MTTFPSIPVLIHLSHDIIQDGYIDGGTLLCFATSVEGIYKALSKHGAFMRTVLP